MISASRRQEGNRRSRPSSHLVRGTTIAIHAHLFIAASDMKSATASISVLRPSTKAANAPTSTASGHKGAAPACRITVIGLGYVGLVTAACLAKLGHDVIGLDADAAKVAALQRGESTIHEAGLNELIAEQAAHGRLCFTTDASEAIPRAALVFVAVGTPSLANGSTQMRAIDEVVALLCSLAQPRSIVVMKSTVPVGTARRVQAALRASTAAQHQVPQVVSNPEFLREGTAVQDFLKPDRILIGCDDGAGSAAALLAQAYEPLVRDGVPVLRMDTPSAELAKCAANAMLAARISFVNEIAALAHATGADIERVCEGIGSDHRIGAKFLRAGLGYGGSCFPKDVAALRHTAREHGLRAEMLAATERVNSRQRCWPLHAMRRDFGGVRGLRGLHAALWGLSFKPGTDDVRDAPSLTLIERLCQAGVHVAVYDPAAMERARACLGNVRAVRWCANAQDALAGADVLVLATEWDEFVACPPTRVAAALSLRIVYDGRNAVDATRWRSAGLRVVQVGRPDVGGAEHARQLAAASAPPRLAAAL
jgi:UDPglucose 6-dehydrogenase